MLKKSFSDHSLLMPRKSISNHSSLMLKKRFSYILALMLLAAAVLTVPGAGVLTVYADTDQSAGQAGADFDPTAFRLPQGAAMLIVVEGTAESVTKGPGEAAERSADGRLIVRTVPVKDTECTVYVYELDGQGGAKLILSDKGNLGQGGMSNYRVYGDMTTPIGVWQLNSPFGQQPLQEGFPQNYVQVDADHVWEDATNTLKKDPSGKIEGERVGTSSYAGYYDYCLDAGYNKAAYPGHGTALFLHCQGKEAGGSSGCVKISKAAMIEVLKLYGRYGEGRCFIAQGPRGKIDRLYTAYGVCGGLSPDGDFRAGK